MSILPVTGCVIIFPSGAKSAARDPSGGRGGADRLRACHARSLLPLPLAAAPSCQSGPTHRPSVPARARRQCVCPGRARSARPLSLPPRRGVAAAFALPLAAAPPRSGCSPARPLPRPSRGCAAACAAACPSTVRGRRPRRRDPRRPVQDRLPWGLAAADARPAASSSSRAPDPPTLRARLYITTRDTAPFFFFQDETDLAFPAARRLSAAFAQPHLPSVITCASVGGGNQRPASTRQGAWSLPTRGLSSITSRLPSLVPFFSLFPQGRLAGQLVAMGVLV